MLIIEGFDNTGKTTVVDRFCKEGGWGPESVIKSPGPVSYLKLFAFADQYISAMEKVKLNKKGRHTNEIWSEYYPFIHDRFPTFSDPVYGPILRNLNPFNDLEEGRWLLGRLMWVQPIIVYCRPTTQTILKFEDGREQMEGVEDNAAALLGKYDETMLYWERRSGRPIIRYSYETESLDNLVERVRAQRW